MSNKCSSSLRLLRHEGLYPVSQPERAHSDMALPVPMSIYPGLRAISGLDELSIDRLASTLAEASPAADADKLSVDVHERLGEPQISDLRQVVRALVNL